MTQARGTIPVMGIRPAIIPVPLTGRMAAPLAPVTREMAPAKFATAKGIIATPFIADR